MRAFERSIDRQNEFLRRAHGDGMSHSIEALARGDEKTALLYLPAALEALKEAEQVWKAVKPAP
jgi:hypothetical protein